MGCAHQLCNNSFKSSSFWSIFYLKNKVHVRYWHLVLTCMYLLAYLDIGRLLDPNSRHIHFHKLQITSCHSSMCNVGVIVCLFPFFCSTGDRWRSRRKMLTPSFHFNILQDFLHIINEGAESLVNKLKTEACDTGQVCDMFPDITLSSLDIICG